ncbi:uncharacterized protein LOC127095408 [Lathyrus oleraceus]|uniref:uncharacterized protein LOC127095408 n=1 Tax=Pisum sativum TaxID=3888 RepID=UPI0021D2435E|nr:uncharacterized protein LOC127095408 [Pisum sativum]
MACADPQKVLYGTHMLLEEAEYWWDNARQRFKANGITLTWVIFRDTFLEKYFPADVRSKKEIEFLELKQGNMTVVDYAAKFEDFSRFRPHYNMVEAEVSKCIKFDNGLRLEIKQFIGYQEIRQFSVLVNKYCMYDENSRVRYARYKSISEKKNGYQSHGKPYVTPVAKEDHKTHQNTASGKGTSEGNAHTSIKCFKCEELGHRALECTSMKVFKCGKSGHHASECKRAIVTCFNFGEQGHIRTQCQKSKQAQSSGRVFALI